uniref:autophagy-related protein 16-1-like n=1 Tax=Styela clava TaxID=7725 RepID=UPI00193A6D93|nr:autophagy-related protein 16-1-like [Styela clava]XP_039271825.1 autophagy-related protein 16-1-like [Styela clava]XP_039271826.1 autophagy-related protein 16-1-like [Styela clava]
MTEPDFREIIFKKLKERNEANDRFADLIQSHNQLFEEVAGLRHDNFQLNIQLEKLKQDNLDLQVKAEAGGGAEKSERYVAIEQKLFRAQEELTEVHRTKGANAQQLYNLNLALQENEKEKNVANDRLREKDEEIKKFKEELENLNQKYDELFQGNQTLRDEHNALHLMCNQLETKLRDSQSENSDLVQKLLEIKNLQAEQIEKERANVNMNKKNSMTATSTTTTTSVSTALPTTTSNGSPPSADGSPQKRSGFPFSRFGEAVSDFFRPKPVARTTSQETGIETPRSPAHQGCLYVTLPSRSRCKWKAHEGEVSSVKFSASGEILATGGSDKVVRLWSVVGEKCMMEHTLRGCNGGITNIDFDPQEQLLIACSSDYAVRLWTMSIQRLKLTLTGHQGKVLSARYLGYGHRLVSGSNDRTVKVWDLKSGSCVKTYLAGSSCNDVVTTDQSGECVASGHFDRKLRFYDTRSGSSATSEMSLGGRITSLDTPLDKNYVVCCTKDHTLEIIDLRKRSVLHSLSHDYFKVATDYSRCAFSPSGEYVAVGSSDGTLLVWNASSGDLETTVHEHDDPVISCSWNGGNLITGDKARNCILWTDV